MADVLSLQQSQGQGQINEAASSCASQPPLPPDEICPRVEVNNPGSKDHPHGCKPCNKFNPARPDDSCKHGDQCDFCHKDHERPKHRGQRGRHALQRRQYLESRAEQPQYLRDLIDEIYRRPHEAIDKIKRELQSQTITQHERDTRVREVLAGIRRIGMEAQERRPDHNRLRGAVVGPECETICSVAELDGRCKWLVGTLHLMVRKMYETKEPQDNISKIVHEVLDQCDKLHEELKGKFAGENSIYGDGGQVKLFLGRFKELEQKVNDFGVDPADLQRDFQDLEETTASMNADELKELKELLRSSNTLKEFRDCMKDNQVLHKFKERRYEQLLNAESLEDMGEDIGVNASSSYPVHWKGNVFRITVIIGSTAQELREKIAEHLCQLCPNAPSVHAAQVRLGVVGLSVELDYTKPVPEAVKENLKVSVVRKYWEDIVNTWPMDSWPQQNLSKLIRTWEREHGQTKESWSNSNDFCRVVGIIDMLLRDFRSIEGLLEEVVKLVENSVNSTNAHPATLLKAIHNCKDFHLDREQLIRFYDLLGDSDDSLHMKLDPVCKFLEPVIRDLTLKKLSLVKEDGLRELQTTQLQIQDECNSLPSTFDTLDLLSPDAVAIVQERLVSIPQKLEDLLKLLREVVRTGAISTGVTGVSAC